MLLVDSGEAKHRKLPSLKVTAKAPENRPSQKETTVDG